jgi:short-subunit dehydrogenase
MPNCLKDKKLPTAKGLQEYGYNAMMKGKKTVAIHGFMNTILATSIRFLPKNLSGRIMKTTII